MYPNRINAVKERVPAERSYREFRLVRWDRLEIREDGSRAAS